MHQSTILGHLALLIINQLGSARGGLVVDQYVVLKILKTRTCMYALDSLTRRDGKQGLTHARPQSRQQGSRSRQFALPIDEHLLELVVGEEAHARFE